MKDPICGMDVDSSRALFLVKADVTYYFCSRRCVERFTAREGVAEGVACTHVLSRKSPIARIFFNKTILVALILCAVLLASRVVPFLVPFRQAFLMYLGSIWWAILLGLVLGGVMDYFVPNEYVSHILAGRRKRSVIYAVLSGFLMSACCHGTIALGIQLHRKGASPAAVASFLLANPWENLPLTIIMFGFFGPKAIFLVASAIIIAVTTGFIFQVLERKGWIEFNSNTAESADDFSVWQDFRKRFQAARFSTQAVVKAVRGIWKGFSVLSDMVLWWILIGIGMASLAAAYVPAVWFHQYMGPSAMGLAVTLGFATLLEVCSEGTAPLAFEIFRQTGAFGNALVFLMAGVATDYTVIGLLWSNVGKRTAIWLPVVAVPQILAVGLLANRLF